MRRLHRLLVTSAAIVLGAPGLFAGEHWQVMQMSGADVGYLHSETLPADANGDIVSRVETRLKMNRLGVTVEIRTEQKTWENAKGQLVRLESESEFSRQKSRTVGVVDGDVMRVTTTTLGKDHQSEIDWPGDVPGSEELRRRMTATKFEPGAELKFWQYQPELGAPVEVTTRFIGPEEIDLPSGKQRLHRTVTKIGGLPDVIGWVDSTGETAKTSTEMVGLKIETFECDKARIQPFLAEKFEGAPVEVFTQSIIRSNVRLPRPRSLDSILYRITPKKGAELPEFEDERQHVVEKDAQTGAVTLLISTVVPPADRRQQRPLADAPPEMAEYLESNAMLQSDDPEIQAFAATAVGEVTDAWTAAQKLELEVDRKITKKGMEVAFASAAETIRTCEGDCSEHACLLAAACRAAGIPSRVAMGVVYVGGIFGGHAWTEVSIDGKWYALDATLGRGSADPTHVRLGASSLKNGAFGTMLTGITSGLGNMNFHLVEGTRAGTKIPFERQKDSLEVVNGRVVDRIEGVSFALPEGFRLEELPPPVGGADIFRKSTIAKVKSAAGVEAQVTLRAVPPDFDPAKFGEKDGKSVPRRIAGKDGFVARGERNVARVLIEDTLYEVVVNGSGDDDGLEAFETIVGSLKFD